MKPSNYTELKQKSEKYAPLDLIKMLGFEETLILAKRMLINDEWDESLQHYATTLLEDLKEKYREKWNSHWKYDAFLGYAYDITLNYDGRYVCYKGAVDKVYPPPPELLVALASCCWVPGKAPITENEAISLVKQAIVRVPYIEAVELLVGLYKSTGDIKEQLYWEKFLECIAKNGVHLPPLDQISDE